MSRTLNLCLLSCALAIWDGRTLRFSVAVPGGGRPAFEMRLVSSREAELIRVDAAGPGGPIRMRRAR
ncbi:MAG TPA: hypothetical protein VMH28_22300 [Candidatus Acidoferrales bacterium]|nr:hypothetical protein [Candidatus Acidoferrales bacterium]